LWSEEIIRIKVKKWLAKTGGISKKIWRRDQRNWDEKIIECWQNKARRIVGVKTVRRITKKRRVKKTRRKKVERRFRDERKNKEVRRSSKEGRRDEKGRRI
jgi:hypothetical protein